MYRRVVRVLRMSVTARRSLPVACTLTPSSGAARLTAWNRFNDDYLLGVTRAPGSITVHYAKGDDAMMRLADLVRAEQSCCTFADWTIDTGPLGRVAKSIARRRRGRSLPRMTGRSCRSGKRVLATASRS